MSLRMPQRAQPPLPCARTGVYMSNAYLADNAYCPVTGERVEDLACPIRIAGAPSVMELGALLKWRHEEVLTAARYGRALTQHVNPTTRVAYRPEDVRLVRFDGQPVEEYNRNVHRLNAALRTGLLSPYVELDERDAARQREGRTGPTLVQIASRRHPATQRFVDEAASLSSSAAADYVAKAEAERAARRAPLMMMPVGADAASADERAVIERENAFKLQFWRCVSEGHRQPWPEALRDELESQMLMVGAGHQTVDNAIDYLFFIHDCYRNAVSP
jgi:hypothetical protein